MCVCVCVCVCVSVLVHTFIVLANLHTYVHTYIAQSDRSATPACVNVQHTYIPALRRFETMVYTYVFTYCMWCVKW